MNFILLFVFLILKKIKSRSDEYYSCMNPENEVDSPSFCSSIIIPDSEGYKCCSMKISYQNKESYNCFPLEKKYIKTKETLDEYISQRSLAPFFSTLGGKVEIDCGENIQIEQKYEKLSDESNSCYNGHLNGVNNENDCINIEIPSKEKNKCCYIETSKLSNNNKIINDKRCYFIKDEYFLEGKNLSNYLIDEMNVKSLDEIENFNITINCKNYEIFTFQGKIHFIDEKVTEEEENSDEKINQKSSLLKPWIFALLIIFLIIM